MRFYCEDIQTESVLGPVESGHLCRVLRAGRGTAVELFDGRGTLGKGVVEKADKKRTLITIHTKNVTGPLTAGRIILAVSFAKGQRFDWLVEKCTELGVDHIAAVHFERTVKMGKPTTMDRYQKIAVSAAKQSTRLHLPCISGPEKLEASIESLMQLYPDAQLLYGEPKAPMRRHLFMTDVQPDRIIVIGPEGGFTDGEMALFKTHNSIGVAINRNILRIETAAVAFCAIAATGRL